VNTIADAASASQTSGKAGTSPHAHNALIKPDYDPCLTNVDLAPLKRQTWGQYNIFAFWMSDVHSVGGYITAGSLFALGLSSWHVLVVLLVSILIVQFFCNLVAKPSQVTSAPYPVICRASFDPDLSGIQRLHDP
jgi:NCS1 family nucleobase:cation symporter-1